MMKAACLVALLFAVSADAKGYGTRVYGTPTGGKNSKVWKYAAVGAGGVAAGALVYYVGSKAYRRHTSYSHNDYDSYYNSHSSDYRRQNPKRSTSCTPAGGLREDETDAWVVAQIVMDTARKAFAPIEVEVDLFQELTFRSPCHPPTQIVVMYECWLTTNRALTAADRTNPTTCVSHGDVESLPVEHINARRKLLQTNGGYVVFEVSAGALSYSSATELSKAFVEAVRDPTGSFATTYKTKAGLHALEVVDVESAGALQPMLICLMAVVVAVLL